MDEQGGGNVSSTTATPYYFTTTAMVPVKEMDYTMGTLLLACSTLGLVGNCIALKYFSTQRRDLSNLIYLGIVCVDIINCSLMFSPGVSYFKKREPFLLAYTWACNIWGIFFHITSRLSVFLVAALSISRTISLCFPFTKLNRLHVLIPTALYSAVLVVPALFPFYFGKEYIYDPLTVLCLWRSFAYDIKPTSIFFMIVYVCIIQLPLLAPFFPIVFSCLISVYQLRKKSPFSGDEATQLKKRYASTTIVLVTVIYIVLNFPVCIFILLEVIEHIAVFQFGYRPHYLLSNNMTMLYLRLLLAVYCVGVNAAVNPIVYLFRFKGFQKYSKNLSKRMKSRIKYTKVNKDCGEMSMVPSGISKIQNTSPFRFCGKPMYELQRSKWSTEITMTDHENCYSEV